MHGPVNYLSGNSLKASILKRARPPAVSPARMAVGRSRFEQASGEARRRPANQPRALFAGPVDDRTTRARRGDSSKPGGRLYLHQEAFGMLAANATIRHQLEPWAARLREDQPHLLAARRARQFGHSETRTGRSRSGCWLHRRLTHRGIRNATNMLSLAASARIWTEPPRMISTSANANRFQVRTPEGTSGEMADENICIQVTHRLSARVSQRNGRLTIAVMR